MGQVVLGTEAKNVLTIGTNGKTAIKIDKVELAEPPFDGFTYEDYCTDEELRGDQTCNITMNWIPIIHGNVQNNFIISWHEANLTKGNAKAAKVPVEGTAIRKEDCNFCENVYFVKSNSHIFNIHSVHNDHIGGRVVLDAWTHLVYRLQ